MDAIILTWGLLPMMLGLGFIFRPRSIAKLERAYAKRAVQLQKRAFKAHRATGLALLLASTVMLLSWFYPVWIFNCFLITRYVAGFIFPAHFETLQTAQVIPTTWI